MKNAIVGTAGHVDHGKSALVAALTGTDPDRLAEEKRRGITLDLGFAFLDIGDVRLGFVDVPGHERFVSNMLAGAGGFDIVVLVIAADESIRPQTREHFDICRLLAIPRGIVALTKSDLVDSHTLELVRLEISEFLQGSFLEGAPIIPVSAKSGAGLEKLSAELARIAVTASEKDCSRYFRLPIDRAFVMKGFGTVVTGTLVSGQVRPGDELELLPANRRVRVRGVHSGGVPVECATAGQRTAINLAGVDLQEAGRGMALAAPGRFACTSQIDARITLLATSPRLKHRARAHFHQGTSQTIAEIHLLEGADVGPRGSALAQLRLADPLLLLPGDRFILRQFSPVVTIGGGQVLDAFPTRHAAKDRARAVAQLRVLEDAGKRDSADRINPSRVNEYMLAAFVSSTPAGMTIDSLIARTGWLEEEVQSAAQALANAAPANAPPANTQKLRIVSQKPFIVASVDVVQACAARILAELDRFHRKNPLVEGAPKENIRERTAAGILPEVFRAALDGLVVSGRVALAGDLVKRSGRGMDLRPEEALAKEQIERQFVQAGLAAPAVEQVLAGLPVETRRAEKLLQLLLREQVLVRVSRELVLHSAAVNKLRELLAEYKVVRGSRLGVGEFKELAGVSRKYAIPLLEYFDRAGVTRREGDARVIL
jgi:selenocysteine-specific elongation factor